MRAKDVMTSNVVSVTPGHSIRHASQIMLDHDISGLPVIDGEGAVVGMLTEGDLLRRCELGGATLHVESPGGAEAARARHYIQAHAWCVKDVMTSPATCVSEEDTLATVAAIFLKQGVKRVPVVREGQVVGIVSRRDLLRAIIDSPEDETIVGDDRILISVLARLREAEDLIGPMPKVSVYHGIISLAGEVRSQQARDAIRVIAEGVRGASGVEDIMTVAPVTVPLFN